MLPQYLQQIITLGSIVLLFVAIYREWVRPVVGFLGVVLGLVLLGILTPQQMLMGFSNESIASVVLLVVLSSALSKNFQIESMIDRIYHLGKRDTPLSYRSFLLRMMIQVAAFSSIVNNTPVVALMTPYVFNWGRKYNVSPSRLLIPLSYATIMGGMITLVGTSTTLVLNGFMTNNGVGDIPGLSLLLIGGAVCLSGISFIALVGHRLLPNHQDILNTFQENQREYLVETALQNNSPLIGKTITEAGLRNLKGMYLVEIIRTKKVVSPVRPEEKLQRNDVLIFAGATEFIFDLTSNGRGLVLPQYDDTRKRDAVKVIEAVVGANSNLIGYTAKEIDFRRRYDAAIVAIHRNGERLSGKIGEIKLRQGDLLLLYAGRDFRNRADLYRDIFIVSQVKEFLQPKRENTFLFMLVTIASIAALLVDFISLFTALLVIFAAMVGLRMIALSDVKREVDINMVGILVFSLALGQAMITTGSGDLVAQQILGATASLGPTAVLASLLIITTLLTSFITNVGAVSIMFPLAYAISNTLQIDGTPLYLGVAYAASSAFLTPIGYQTNLIVYGPGGYNFRDFFRIGLPITAIYLATVLSMIKLLYPDF
ncbi:SLC13 family permease [Tunicatimonas pelagia]|uniref:SLC13 family permease n=1 Tax=Tunicatimonas pelagia TaxID=931531 RepID=UPI0026650100|nr:SLC13 family permease [Tunicatimonas pelagia]WKN41258.1 SLC13 family permease [Tunicatimonas pelagia]